MDLAPTGLDLISVALAPLVSSQRFGTRSAPGERAVEFLYFPGCKLTRQGAKLPRRGGRFAHHALRAELLQRSLRTTSEPARFSVVRPIYVQLRRSADPASQNLIFMDRDPDYWWQGLLTPAITRSHSRHGTIPGSDQAGAIPHIKRAHPSSSAQPYGPRLRIVATAMPQRPFYI
jgi:hypothetical protein